MKQEYLEEIMSLIIHAGNAKSSAMEAIQQSKTGHFTEAYQKLEEARQEISLAHKGQTDMLTKEANQEPMDWSLLLVHSQDHLMTALTFLDMAQEMVELYQKVS